MWKIVWKYLRWCLVIPVLFQFFRWIMACIFGGLYRFFRSSAAVKEKQDIALENYREHRREIVLRYFHEDPYRLIMPILDMQSRHYISIETLQTVMELYAIDAETIKGILEHCSWTLTDVPGIEEGLGITLANHHDSDPREAHEKRIGRDYRGDEFEESPKTLDRLVKAMAETSPEPNWH